MMYPRLFLARQLLREDGVIFVSIDDHEVHNLRLLMDEIFGGENFIAQLVWQSKKGGGGAVSQIVGDHEYILLYARESHPEALGRQSLDSPPLDMEDEKGPYRKGRELNKWGAGSARADRPTMFFPIPGPNGQDVYPIRNDGSEGRWRWGKKNMLAIVQNGDALFEPRPDGTYIVYEKIREAGPSLRAYRSLLLDVGTVADGTAELKELFGGKSPFDFPKPPSLIRHLQDIGALEEDDIVLDFFAGSGTTAQAALESNHEDGASRQFIMVQLPEPTSRGDYRSIADVAKERARGVIRKLRSAEQGSLIPHDPDDRVDLGFRVFRMDASTSRPWVAPAEGETPSAQEYADRMALFTDPLVPGWKAEDVIWEVAVKEGYGLSSRIEVDKRVNGATVYRVTDADKGQSFRICLDDKLTLGVVKKLGLSKDELFVCRDVALDDEAAANLALQCRLKTI
jgi:adenine-specific DNA-methyltransferase